MSSDDSIRFDNAWIWLASANQVDAFGSVEYHRVRVEYAIALPLREPVLQWIHRAANRPATGEQQ